MCIKAKGAPGVLTIPGCEARGLSEIAVSRRLMVAGAVMSVAIAAVVALRNGEITLQFLCAVPDTFLDSPRGALDAVLRVRGIVLDVLAQRTVPRLLRTALLARCSVLPGGCGQRHTERKSSQRRAPVISSLCPPLPSSFDWTMTAAVPRMGMKA